MVDKFEDKYLDVLQNIESALAVTYREHDEMTDWDARDAIKALARAYQAETRGLLPSAPRLNTVAQDAYDKVKLMCDWRLGRRALVSEKNKGLEQQLEFKTVDEIIQCLKRVQRSVEMWQKKGGRRGYFDFISEFVP
jgi:hypothetical protein